MILCIGTTPAVQRTLVFSALAIGEVNRAVEVYETPAGKSGNVAKVLAALGEQALASGFVGGARGEFLSRELARLGIRHDFVAVEPETRLCITLIDRGGQTHTELIQESQSVGDSAWAELSSKLPGLLRQAKALVLSGTLPPEAPVDFYRQCMEAANAVSIPTVLDARGEPLLAALSARPTVVKPNLSELAATFGTAVNTDEAQRDAIPRLHDAGAQWVMVTLGRAGAILSDGRRAWRLTSPAVPTVNSIGSGDAVAAGLAAGLVRGQSMLDAAKLGIACGAANAMTLLSADVRAEDVVGLLRQVQVERDRHET